MYRRLGGLQGRSGRVRKMSPPPGFDPWTVQPVVSHYTDWAKRPTCLKRYCNKMHDVLWHTGRRTDCTVRIRVPIEVRDSFLLQKVLTVFEVQKPSIQWVKVLFPLVKSGRGVKFTTSLSSSGVTNAFCRSTASACLMAWTEATFFTCMRTCIISFILLFIYSFNHPFIHTCMST
jgi:hypothetical protein